MKAPLNAVCPYFTMFPLGFPLKVLARGTRGREPVLDPFCGRGTTNLAARLCDMTTTGIDTHPVAAAVAQAKLVTTTPQAITACLDEILRTEPDCANPPRTRSGNSAFHEATLQDIARVRAALLRDTSTPERQALQAGPARGPSRAAHQVHALSPVQSVPRDLRTEAALCAELLATTRAAPSTSRHPTSRRAPALTATTPKCCRSRTIRGCCLQDSRDPEMFKQTAR